MDLLFGTYRCPDHEPAAFGLRHSGPRTYLGLLVRPLLPRARRRPKADDATRTDPGPVASPREEPAALPV
jgi:hypothetical protein